MRSTTSPNTPNADTTPQPSPPPTVRPDADRPETVMVCELLGGGLLLRAAPDGPLIHLTGQDAEPLRTALDAAFRPSVSGDRS